MFKITKICLHLKMKIFHFHLYIVLVTKGPKNPLLLYFFIYGEVQITPNIFSQTQMESVLTDKITHCASKIQWGIAQFPSKTSYIIDEAVLHVIDPLLFSVIPRSPKLTVKTLPLSNLFKAKFHFHFRFYYPWLSF